MSQICQSFVQSVSVSLVTIKYRVTHSGFTTFKGLKIGLKQYAHQKTGQFPLHKGPPFTLNHQLISADYFAAVKLDLK